MKKKDQKKSDRKKKSRYQPARRRKVIMNFALVMVMLMAASLVMTSIYNKISNPTNFKAQTPTIPAKHSPLGI